MRLAIPQDHPLPPRSKVLFNPKITQMLSAKGKQLGADPVSWRTEVPSVQP